ncbi:MAG: AcrR family transcriptional regulator [Pseudohongiellaceae bacterium]|jgi:AcrR family transcriptional regulator
MIKAKQETARIKAKKETVFDAAAVVFAQYGFRRTTMNDIAEAASMSRPALYLMFANKENLFYELANHRLDEAVEQASAVLSGSGSSRVRFIDALLIFEKIYYEPIADSPHGAELMDINQSLAADTMMNGVSTLIAAFAKLLKQAEKSGEVSFEGSPLTAKSFVELLLTAIAGVKKKASSKAEFRKQTEQVAEIFLAFIMRG